MANAELRVSVTDLPAVAKLLALVASEHRPVESSCEHTHCAVCSYFVEGEGTYATAWPCRYAEAMSQLTDHGHTLRVVPDGN